MDTTKLIRAKWILRKGILCGVEELAATFPEIGPQLFPVRFECKITGQLGHVETITPSTPDYSLLSGQSPAGFWQRLFAFLIDGIVVSIPSFALAEVFRDFLLGSPLVGKLLGFAITITYFAIFGSEIVDGQTLGMMALHLKVVHKDGSIPSLRLSFLRYSILFIPFLLSSGFLSDGIPALLASTYETIMEITGIAIVYLAIFNRRTGQSLHDLATNTFVVDSPGAGTVHFGEFWRPHLAIITGILILSYGAVEILPRTSTTFSELTAIQNSVQRTTNVNSVDVQLKFSGKESGFLIGAPCDRISRDHERASLTIVKAVLVADPQAKSRDYIEVSCITTLSVGFFKSSSRDSFTHTPEEWQEIIEKK